MSSEIKTYVIGEKKYEQRPLVLGQFRQMMGLLTGVTFNPAAGVTDIIGILGDKLPHALAIVLIPEGSTAKDKNLVELAAEIEFNILPATIVEVVEGFFDCNPMASFFERLEGMLKSLNGRIPMTTGLKPLSVSSPVETLPAETPSSGDLLPESADLTSGHESVS